MPAPCPLSDEPSLQLGGIAHRGRQPGGAHRRCDAAEPGQVQRQQVAALAGGDGVELVEHHTAQVGEQGVAVGRGQQQRELLRRGQQDVRRRGTLALALGDRGVAGARLDREPQRQVGGGDAQVALDVDGQRLERRDVERVQPLARSIAAPRRRRPARRGSAGNRPASCRRRSARSAARPRRPVRQRATGAGAGEAASRAPRTSRRSARAASPVLRRRRERGAKSRGSIARATQPSPAWRCAVTQVESAASFMMNGVGSMNTK